MRPFRLPRLATALLATAAIGLCAAGGSASAAGPATRTIEVPAGAVVLVLPPGAVPGAMPAFAPELDDPVPALLAHMNLIMQQAFAAPGPDRLMEAALQRVQAGVPASGVMVTTVSNGRESCTRTVTFGGPARPAEVRLAGNGCHGEAAPVAAPQESMPAAAPAPAPTLRVDRHRPATIQVAQLER